MGRGRKRNASSHHPHPTQNNTKKKRKARGNMAATSNQFEELSNIISEALNTVDDPMAGNILPSTDQSAAETGTGLQSSPQKSTQAPTHDQQQGMSQIDSKLNKILAKLESMETKLTNVDTKVTFLENNLRDLTQRVGVLETSVQFYSETADKVNGIEAEVKTLSSEMGIKMKSLIKDHNYLNDELLDLKCRSMRNNLMFFNIEEEKEENTEKVVKTFMTDVLKVKDVAEIELERVHRVGDKAKPKRPIVAMFTRYPDKLKVQKKAGNLRDTDYGIADQFPREIVSRRKALIPFLKDARDRGNHAVLAVDKLFINGSRFFPPAEQRH
jgi:uncharacterized coiled-coil protein SlyX